MAKRAADWVIVSGNTGNTASKPVAQHLYLPNHSQKHIAVCGFLSLLVSDSLYRRANARNVGLRIFYGG